MLMGNIEGKKSKRMTYKDRQHKDRENKGHSKFEGYSGQLLLRKAEDDSS